MLLARTFAPLFSWKTYVGESAGLIGEEILFQRRYYHFMQIWFAHARTLLS